MPSCATPTTRSFAPRRPPSGPDCCIVSAGYDLHEGDPLADLAVSDQGVREIVRAIVDACAGIPLVCTLEGGYHLATLARCVGITLEELLR